MIVLNVNSQLGNQMFQYALYRKLLFLGKKVKLDLRYYSSKPEHFGLDIFNIKYTVATQDEIANSRDERRYLADRIRRKIFNRRNNIFEEVTSHTLKYKPEVFKLYNGYVDGYWQSEKYFKEIKNVIIQDFTFPKIDDENNIALIEQIKLTNSVSIHIRRGDYVNGFPMMDKEYYDEAIRYFEEKHKDTVFYVFSNDMEWAKENIQAKELIFVDCNTGTDSWKDMYLMTLCKHNIIANSSFSWWGAWLNQNIDKEVIAPSIWLYHQETPDVYAENWKII